MDQAASPSGPGEAGQDGPRTGAGPRRSTAVPTAWYRSSVGWRRQRSSYLLLVLVIGLTGGVALGSIAAARRTASSFPTFLAATNPSDLMIEPAGGRPGALNRTRRSPSPRGARATRR